MDLYIYDSFDSSMNIYKGAIIPTSIEEACNSQHTALLVYDAQVGIFNQIKEKERIVSGVLQTLKAAPEAGDNASDLLGEALRTHMIKPSIESLLVGSSPRNSSVSRTQEKINVELPEENDPELLKTVKKPKQSPAVSRDYYQFFEQTPKGVVRKSVLYVAAEWHEKLSHLTRRLSPRTTLAEYLEHILEDHFEKHSAEISALLSNSVEEERGRMKF